MIGKRFFTTLIAASLLAGAPFAATTSAASTDTAKSENSPNQPKKVRMTGHVVCLTEAMGKAYQVEFPSDHQHQYGFKTTDGHFYTLFRNRFSEPLFVEKSLKEKKLTLTGKLLPQSNVLAVDQIQSIHDGKLHDVYYYCDVCAIKAVEPGPCMCCQQPVELVEEAVDGS